jgi:hypothetical protein
MKPVSHPGLRLRESIEEVFGALSWDIEPPRKTSILSALRSDSSCAFATAALNTTNAPNTPQAVHREELFTGFSSWLLKRLYIREETAIERTMIPHSRGFKFSR